MNRAIVRTQAEWDALPARFDEYTVIEVRSIETILIYRNPDNSRAELRGSSRAELRESSRAELWGRSVAYQKSVKTPELYGQSVCFL